MLIHINPTAFVKPAIVSPVRAPAPSQSTNLPHIIAQPAFFAKTTFSIAVPLISAPSALANSRAAKNTHRKPIARPL
jgi:hypothetical protein